MLGAPCKVFNRFRSVGVIVSGSDNKTPKRLQKTITALWCQDKS